MTDKQAKSDIEAAYRAAAKELHQQLFMSSAMFYELWHHVLPDQFPDLERARAMTVAGFTLAEVIEFAILPPPHRIETKKLPTNFVILSEVEGYPGMNKSRDPSTTLRSAQDDNSGSFLLYIL